MIDFFLPRLYGAFTSSVTLLCARLNTMPLLLSELESRLVGLCVCVAVAGAGAAEVQRRGHRWPPPSRRRPVPALWTHSSQCIAHSSWHVALFIALIIVRLRRVLEEQSQGARRSSGPMRAWWESDRRLGKYILEFIALFLVLGGSVCVERLGMTIMMTTQSMVLFYESQVQYLSQEQPMNKMYKHSQCILNSTFINEERKKIVLHLIHHCMSSGTKHLAKYNNRM